MRLTKILSQFFNCHVTSMVSIALMSKSSEQIFYAVGVGRNVGIYKTWGECKSQVDGIKNPKFRKFSTLSEAEEFVKFWKNKSPSPSKLIILENPVPDHSASVDKVQERCHKASSTGRVRANIIHSNKKSENESVNVKSLQEAVRKCEKKIDFYINGLNTMVSGLNELKHDFGQIRRICNYFIGRSKGEVTEVHDSKPESPKKKSTASGSEDGDLFKDEPDPADDNILGEITIDDFDFSEFDDCENSLKRKRSSSEDDADKNESCKRSNKVFTSEVGKDLVPFVRDENDYVTVYTDGCCLSNGTSGAKAGIGIWFGEDHPLNVSEPITEAVPTNNNAEIQAARVAMEVALKANISKLKIITDSQFLINSATKWMPKWKLNDWVGVNNKNVVNRQELEKLDKVMSLLAVRWEKVGGHKGVRGNEAADRLANKGALLYRDNATGF